MEAEHMKEPWPPFDASMAGNSLALNRADYNHASACVNACAGINPDAVPDLLAALQGLFEHCAMVHNRWGDGDNTKEANKAIETARLAIAKATGEGE